MNGGLEGSTVTALSSFISHLLYDFSFLNLLILLSVLTSLLSLFLLSLLLLALLIFLTLGILDNIKRLYFERINQKRFIPEGKIKKIAIIGAGPSGIAAAKEALESGFSVTVFEQTDKIGGNWVFKEGEHHSSVYRSTCINTSRQAMCFSDYPMPESYPTYPHHPQICRYFEMYADHFGVTPKILFHTQVLSLTPAEDDSWEIEYQHTKDGKPLYLSGTSSNGSAQKQRFDGVVIASGHHAEPRTPEFKGADGFKGHVIHSHAYKDPWSPFDYRSKRVLVVGIGNSGVDVSSELSRVARQVYLSTRTGAWVIPKFIHGMAMDHFFGVRLSRLIYTLLPRWFTESPTAAGLMEKEIVKTQGSMKSWGLDPACRLNQTHPTVSQDLLPRIATGSIRVKPQIEKFTADGVLFEDGTKADVDAVIFCTGYTISYPFISQQLLPVKENRIDLYKFVFPPSLPPTIAILGLIQPLGAIMPISEMQARVVCALWKGRVGLPSVEDMLKDIKLKREKMEKRYLARARHTIQVDFGPYMDELADWIGALPKMFPPSQISAWKTLWLGPVWPPQYRLDGPGKWSGAAEAMNRAYNQIYYERPEKEASKL